MSHLGGLLSTMCKHLVIATLVVLGMTLLVNPTTGVAYADGMNWDAVAQCESGAGHSGTRRLAQMRRQWPALPDPNRQHLPAPGARHATNDLVAGPALSH